MHRDSQLTNRGLHNRQHMLSLQQIAMEHTILTHSAIRIPEARIGRQRSCTGVTTL